MLPQPHPKPGDVGYLLSAKRQFPLQSGPAHPRHGDVEDQTSGLTDAIGREKLFSQRLDREAELPQQVGPRLARGLIRRRRPIRASAWPSRVPHDVLRIRHPGRRNSPKTARVLCTLGPLGNRE